MKNGKLNSAPTSQTNVLHKEGKIKARILFFNVNTWRYGWCFVKLNSSLWFRAPTAKLQFPVVRVLEGVQMSARPSPHYFTMRQSATNYRPSFSACTTASPFMGEGRRNPTRQFLSLRSRKKNAFSSLVDFCCWKKGCTYAAVTKTWNFFSLQIIALDSLW